MMSYRPRNRSIERLVEDIDAKLRHFVGSPSKADLRSKVKQLVEVQRRFSDLGVSVAHKGGVTASSARERIRLYFVMYEGAVIDGEELQIVSGIAEFARRIRELRVEDGYQIASGASPDPETGIELHPDQYVLVTSIADETAARRWHVANRIRRSGGSSQSRVLEYLKENVAKVVTTEELAYVAKDKKEFARRARELRTEQGYLVATRFTGRPDLGQGQYILESIDRIAEAHDRNLPDHVPKAVYKRDNNTCQCCGWNREKWKRSDPRILELHHVDEHAGGGPNTVENLIVLCSRCHDDVHAKRIVLTLKDGVASFHNAAGS